MFGRKNQPEETNVPDNEPSLSEALSRPLRCGLGAHLEYGIYGDARRATGITQVVLEPVESDFLAEVGEVVSFKVTAIHRETIERVTERR